MTVVEIEPAQGLQTPSAGGPHFCFGDHTRAKGSMIRRRVMLEEPYRPRPEWCSLSCTRTRMSIIQDGHDAWATLNGNECIRC